MRLALRGAEHKTFLKDWTCLGLADSKSFALTNGQQDKVLSKCKKGCRTERHALWRLSLIFVSKIVWRMM